MTAGKEAHARRVGGLFDAKAAAWSDKYAAGGKLVARLERFEQTLASFASSSAGVVDFGCGSGELAQHLAGLGYRVTGVDISSAMLRAARERFGEVATWIELPQAWNRLPFDDGAFDAAVSSSALEYVPEVDLVLRELARVLRPGGVLAFTVPDTEHPIRMAEAAAKLVFRRIAALPLPRKVGSFAEYLELSKNRFGEDAWTALARLTGFEPVPNPDEPKQTLKMLVFRRL